MQKLIKPLKFDVDHHRFTSEPIPEFTFEVTGFEENFDSHLNNLIRTNLMWNVDDFIENGNYHYSKLTSSIYKTRTREFNFLINITAETYSGRYNQTCKLLKQTFQNGKTVTLKNAEISMVQVFGRAYIDIEYDSLWVDNVEIPEMNSIFRKELRYRAYEDGVDYGSYLLNDLVYSLGSKVEHISDEEIAETHERYDQKNREETAQRAARALKSITPEKLFEIVKLREVEKLSFEKISKIFGVHKTTIIAHYHKCKAKEVTKLKGVSK